MMRGVTSDGEGKVEGVGNDTGVTPGEDVGENRETSL